MSNDTGADLLIEANPDRGVFHIGFLILVALMFAFVGVLPDDTLESISADDGKVRYRLFKQLFSNLPIIVQRITCLGFAGCLGFIVWKLDRAYGKKRELLKLTSDRLYDLRSDQSFAWSEVQRLSFVQHRMQIQLMDRTVGVEPIALVYVTPSKNKIIDYIKARRPELLG